MSPEFAAAIDPIFMRVLDLLDRISLRQADGVATERGRIMDVIRDAEGKIGNREGWQHIRYALAAWIDEMLIAAPWDGKTYWENNTLEFDFFRTQTRALDFYTKAQEADRLSTRDPIEVAFLCVLLGFRGFYAASPADARFLAEQRNLPGTIEMWTTMTSRQIKAVPPSSPSIDMRSLEGAPPLQGKFLAVGSLLICAMMISLFIVVWTFFISDQLTGLWDI